MTPNQTRDQIMAAVWKAIAKSDLDLSALDKAELEQLVTLVTEAALIAVDDRMAEDEAGDKDAAPRYYPEGSGEERVLWQGRPFLSINQHYTITNERVRVVHGLLGKDREDIELIRIQDVDQHQTLPERALNLGDITIRSHDSSDPLIVLNNVRDPQNVHEILRRAVLDIRKQNRFSFQEEM